MTVDDGAAGTVPSVLPMFPLGMVLLPGMVLPLHVFERRYLALVSDCLAMDRPEFGVTLIVRGSEVGGGDQRAMVGTIASIVQVHEVGGGRLGLVAVGDRRCRVSRWLADDPYPRAEVEDWPDADEAVTTAERVAGLARRVRAAAALANELGDGTHDLTTEISADHGLASHQLAAMAPVGPADRYRLLTAGSTVERLDLLAQMLDELEPVLRFRLAGE